VIAWAEHRYFGESIPFPKNISLEQPYVQWLTVEQALKDSELLIDQLRYDYGNRSVIPIGGRYGGMLAAYLRMQSPDLVQGAIASSAPMLMFANGTVDEFAFVDKVTERYGSSHDDSRCSANIKSAFERLNKNVESEQAWASFNRIFHPCTEVTSAREFAAGMHSLIEGLQDLTISGMVKTESGE
jgi:lysosomal Pro-X carboxypeptidase